MFVRRRRWNSLKLLLWFLFQQPLLFSTTDSEPGRQSLQLGVLRLGLLQDRDIGVGVFPDSKEASLRQADAAQQVLEARVGSGLGAGGMRRDDHSPDTNWRGEQD
jgi:hypothetical protein